MATSSLRGSRPDAGDQPGAKALDRSNRKVEAILSAARSLFLERSFDAITMDMVTRASGVSKATLYVYFDNKEELFGAVLAEEARRLTDEIWQMSEAEKEDNEDAGAVLRRVAWNFVDVFLTERAVVLRRAVLGSLSHYPSMGRAIFDAAPKALMGRLSRFLASAHSRGALHVPNTDLAADQFLSLVRSDFDLRGVLSLPLPTHEQINEHIEAGIAMFMNSYSRSARDPR
jgi:AcrR family transcriptional regulator